MYCKLYWNLSSITERLPHTNVARITSGRFLFYAHPCLPVFYIGTFAVPFFSLIKTLLRCFLDEIRSINCCLCKPSWNSLHYLFTLTPHIGDLSVASNIVTATITFAKLAKLVSKNFYDTYDTSTLYNKVNATFNAVFYSFTIFKPLKRPLVILSNQW